jgi:spermidine synthase
MAVDSQWVTEYCDECGSAFSLKLRGKVHEEQSGFQKIEVYETASWGNLMLIDGYTMVSTRDNFLYHEMMAHPALYSHEAPARVAIIGGGDCGTLREVLRHPEVREVTQIDIDERVTRVAEQFFPELCASNADPRARLLFIDGIQWISEAEPGSLDVVIVDSTDPIGPGEVLFTDAFYAAAHRALGDGGMIVQQSESPLLHQPILERMYRDLYGAGFADVRTLFFPQPIYPSGWWSATLGCKGRPVTGFREADVAGREFDTRYYNVDVHRAAFAEPEFFRRAAGEWRKRWGPAAAS